MHAAPPAMPDKKDARSVDEVPLPQPSRLGRQPGQPLQPVVAHPLRCARRHARQ